MQLASAGEKRLGPQDVGTAGQRAVCITGPMAPDHLGDLGRHAYLSVILKPAWIPLASDPVAAEVHDRGPGEDAQQLRIAAPHLADRTQLPAGGGQRGEVAAMSRRRAPSSPARGGLMAEHEVRLPLGGRGVVRVLAAGRKELEHDRRQLYSRGRRVLR